jgi:maleylpyruvate isomerase
MEGARAARELLERDLARLSAEDVRAPSLLPDWTRAHVLTHLARNADSHVRLLEAAALGERVEQYEGGPKGRAADIEAGATRDAAAIVEDVVGSSRRLSEVWDATRDNVWDAEVSANLGTHPAWVLVWRRWREVEIHHVDLALGYAPQDWPAGFLDRSWAELVAGLPARLPTGAQADLVAWMLGRATGGLLPKLPSWS